MIESIKGLSKARKNDTSIKLVAFDLDGTLIRGRNFRYSWQLIWQYLKYPDEIRVKYFNDYEDNKISYEEWCHKCVEYYKRKGLMRSDFTKMANRLRVTNNFEETIMALKIENIKTAIISGGIDTFLIDLIPKHKELFDYVYINRFEFSSSGKLETVIPTKYDFEGKVECIKLLCKKENFQLSECMFIGEEKNDRHVIDYFREMNQGITIAYPQRDTDVTNRATYRIEKDDLLGILKFVMKNN